MKWLMKLWTVSHSKFTAQSLTIRIISSFLVLPDNEEDNQRNDLMFNESLLDNFASECNNRRLVSFRFLVMNKVSGDLSASTQVNSAICEQAIATRTLSTSIIPTTTTSSTSTSTTMTTADRIGSTMSQIRAVGRFDVTESLLTLLSL